MAQESTPDWAMIEIVIERPVEQMLDGWGLSADEVREAVREADARERRPPPQEVRWYCSKQTASGKIMAECQASIDGQRCYVIKVFRL